MINERNNGIDLLRVIAIFMIVISHVAQSLGEVRVIEPIINLLPCNVASANIDQVVTMFFRHFGGIGNVIFISCASYFLLNSNKVKKEKIVNIILINFSISVIILFATLIMGYGVPLKKIVASFFPTLKSLNWFVSCYILFYMIHGYVNDIINKISKKTHFAICLFLIIFYFILNVLFFANNFFYSEICNFITIYFIVAYMKKYCENIMNNKKVNIIMVLVGSAVLITNHFLNNYIGLKIDFFSNRAMLIMGDTKIYNLLISIGLLNILSKIDIKSKNIQKLSSITLLIYIIHENLLIREIFRPIVWNKIYNVTQYKYLTVTTIIYAIVLFVLSVIAAFIYNKLFNNILNKVTNKIVSYAENVFNKVFKISEKYLN